jgi:hypothetical protein
MEWRVDILKRHSFLRQNLRMKKCFAQLELLDVH